ncbi:MAG: sulfotransferase [Proteobacteria bacterium]|nr:sulfotransferase [Pseudomonadota bacterium]
METKTRHSEQLLNPGTGPVPGDRADVRVSEQQARKANGFRPPVPDTSTSALDQGRSLATIFERVVVVNLDRRKDRWEEFSEHIVEVDWPFTTPQRFRAVDGTRVAAPRWWRAGPGAWGCFQSHVRIIEQALMDGVKSILILEDDAVFPRDFRARAEHFLRRVPGDWDQIYFGGQHITPHVQPPIQLNEDVVQPFSVGRTHAYALHERFLTRVYRFLTDYESHLRRPRYHVDHRLGELHQTGKVRVFAPSTWMVGQREGRSSILGEDLPTRFWHEILIDRNESPFVAVMGLHRSGSSCLAGVLSKLGVHMGTDLIGYESTGGFEDWGLARLCEDAYPFPTTKLRLSADMLLFELRAYVRMARDTARRKGTIAGGKYPQLCAMGDLLHRTCGDQLKIIHIDRPKQESIASLKTRCQHATGSDKASDGEVTRVQEWLWQEKQQFLQKHEHLTIQYADLCRDPHHEIKRIIHYLGITPSSAAIDLAAGHVRPELAVHSGIGESSDGQWSGAPPLARSSHADAIADNVARAAILENPRL